MFPTFKIISFLESGLWTIEIQKTIFRTSWTSSFGFTFQDFQAQVPASPFSTRTDEFGAFLGNNQVWGTGKSGRSQGCFLQIGRFLGFWTILLFWTFWSYITTLPKKTVVGSFSEFYSRPHCRERGEVAEPSSINQSIGLGEHQDIYIAYIQVGGGERRA